MFLTRSLKSFSISKKEILDYLLEHNIKIKSDDLLIRNQIKSIGDHKVEISPYDDISVEVSISVNKN